MIKLLLIQRSIYCIAVTPLLCFKATEKDVAEALSSRRQVILDNIRDNDEAGVNYQRVNLFLIIYFNSALNYCHCLSYLKSLFL